ncbi:HAL/PAL/TAL family ammonia-lyase [Blautia marasmi]|uniref:HAL/PAL/TAL family ammonia-lyase n=1 Tax=Blautia marasmi TaxID=1917868 RepID=UPI000CF29A7C|nr:aromatic amino acid ammonia-lyase [Blautia marasmi]
MEKIVLDGKNLTLDQIYEVVYHGAIVELSEEAMKRAEKAKQVLYRMVDSEIPVYGTNRGVGWNKDRKVYTEYFDQYNKNLLRSHSLCVPPYCTEEEVRAIMLIRLNTALYGCAGLSRDVLERYRDFLNKRIHPLVPRRSSVGEADLAVNAMIGMSMIGENDVLYQGQPTDSLKAMEDEGMKPLVLGPKDGLGIVSSNSQAAAMAALLLREVKELTANSNLIYCIGLEGLNGQIQQLDRSVTEAKGFPEQTECAQECLHMLESSYLFDGTEGKALQDPLSFRDSAFINGAVLECVKLLEMSLNQHLNHSDDNPCVLPDEERVSVSCNFEPLNLALKAEMLNIALNHISKGACHRILKLADPSFTGLPRFLSPDGGKTVIGYSTIQKTFTSLDTENRALANPSSMDFFALSGYIEDHASNAVLILEKSFKIVDNLRYILGMELMHAAQAVDLRGNYKLGKCTGKAFEEYRKIVPFLDKDRKLSVDIQASYEVVKSNKLLKASGCCNEWQ